MRKKKFFNSAFWEGFASINLFGAPEKPLKKKREYISTKI